MDKQSLIERNVRALEKRKPADIIFFHPYGFIPTASVILAVTGEYYHHGAIVIDQETLIESDFPNGVEISKLEGYLDKYYLDLFRINLPIDQERLLQCAKKYTGWSYDYGNVLWAGLGYIWSRVTGSNFFRTLRNPYDEDKSVESEEFLDLVFSDYGLDLCPGIPSSNVTAQTIANSSLIHLVKSDE